MTPFETRDLYMHMLEFYNEVQEFKDGKNNEERMNETPDEVRNVWGPIPGNKRTCTTNI